MEKTKALRFPLYAIGNGFHVTEIKHKIFISFTSFYVGVTWVCEDPSCYSIKNESGRDVGQWVLFCLMVGISAHWWIFLSITHEALELSQPELSLPGYLPVIWSRPDMF